MIGQADGPTWQDALLLAGLSYRGGVLRDAMVEAALRRGLEDLAPDWELVWGPVEARVPPDFFDVCAMYVARHRRRDHQYVVAVRGTNPTSLADWTLGDFNVATQVAWPFDGSARVSTSTAFGLRMLLGLRWIPGSSLQRTATNVLTTWRLPKGLVDVVRGVVSHSERWTRFYLRPMERRLQEWVCEIATRQKLPQVVGRDLAAAVRVQAADLEVTAALGASGGMGVVAFLRDAAKTKALDVVVTGHSKGGALAPTLALWLHQARGDWDASGGSRVGCCAFAGPTPGDGAFARLLERELGVRFVRVHNTNDVVTHAWDDAGLAGIPTLFGAQTIELQQTLDDLRKGLAAGEPPLDYAQPDRPPVRQMPFAGTLVPSRTFAAEFVHQHMDAYLDHAGFHGKVDAIDLFLG